MQISVARFACGYLSKSRKRHFSAGVCVDAYGVSSYLRPAHVQAPSSRACRVALP